MKSMMCSVSELQFFFVFITLIWVQITLKGVQLTESVTGKFENGIHNTNESIPNSKNFNQTNKRILKNFPDCIYKKGEHIYDLSSLAQKNFWFFAEPDADNKEVIFFLSICHPIENISSCQDNSGICMTKVNSSLIHSNGYKLKNNVEINNISFTSIGKIPKEGPEVFQEGSLKYMYENGSICNDGFTNKSYSVALFLQCPRLLDIETPGPQLMSSSGCNYIFVWETKAACPKGIEPTSDPCVIQFSNSEYQLNLHSLHTDTFYKVFGKNSSFEINICGPIQNGSCPDNTAICDTSDSQKPKVLATSEQISFNWKEDALIISYINTKHKEGFSSVNIYLYCNRQAFTPRLHFLPSNTSNFYNFSISTINVCNPEPSDCVFEDNKLNVYDLRPLHKKEANWEVIRRSKNKTSHYYLNVCGPINPEKNGKCPPGPIGACQPSVASTGSRNIGYITSDPVVNEDGSITLMYTGGHSCKKGVQTSSTRITFLCSNIDYPPVFLDVTDSCEHLIEWHTPSACPVHVVSSKDCRISDPLYGYNFDLSPLRNTTIDYQISNGNETFRINVCGPLVNACGEDKKAAVCLAGEKSGGEAPAELIFNDGTMMMRFSNGAPGCGDNHWSSQLLLLCSHEKDTDALYYIHSEENTCVHHFLLHTPHACPPIEQVNCLVIEGNLVYDLTELSNPRLNEIFIVRERDRKYILNVCRSIVHSKEDRCPYDAGACLVDLSHKNKTLSLGRVGLGPQVEHGQLKLRYDQGDPCNATHTHSTIIDFECTPDEYQLYPILFAEENCVTIFKWSTMFACPRSQSDPPAATTDKTAGNCIAVNPFTNYVFDINTLKTEKPYSLTVRKGVTLLITLCGAVKDPRCSEQGAGACLIKEGKSTSAGIANQALHFYMWTTYLDYEGGEECSNGLKRSTRISFVCSNDSELMGPVLIEDDTDACTFFIHWYTEKACERHIRCFAESWNETIDLSPLIRYRENYVVKDPNDTDSFYLINVCRPLNPYHGINCHPGSSSCLVLKNKEPLGLGQPFLNPTIFFTDKKEKQVHLMYSYGSECPSDPNFSLSSRLIFICDRSAGVGSPQYLRVVNECQYQFEWRTSAVCPPLKNEEEVADSGQCQIAYEVAKTNVDLSPLRREKPYNVTHEAASFLLNMCGASACENGVAVCTPEGTNYGKNSQSQLQWDHDDLLMLTFYGGSSCEGSLSGTRSTRIFFVCDLNAGLGTPRLDPASDDLHCTAVFNWHTNLTCLEALYPEPPSPNDSPIATAKPRNDSQAPSSQSQEGDQDDSSQHTWLSALIAGVVLTGVVAAFVFVVGRSSFGRRLYARAKRTFARKGYASAAESDTLLHGETAFVYRVDEDEQVLRV